MCALSASVLRSRGAATSTTSTIWRHRCALPPPWVHRNLPRVAALDSWRSRSDAWVPPVDYGDGFRRCKSSWLGRARRLPPFFNRLDPGGFKRQLCQEHIRRSQIAEQRPHVRSAKNRPLGDTKYLISLLERKENVRVRAHSASLNLPIGSSPRKGCPAPWRDCRRKAWMQTCERARRVAGPRT